MFVDWENLIALVQARSDETALLAAKPLPQPEVETGALEPDEMPIKMADADPSLGEALAPVGVDPFSV